MPAAAQLVRRKSLLLSPQRMQGSTESCDAKPVRFPRYNSYRPGARNDVPRVARIFMVGTTCQFKPSFQTESEPSTES